MASPAVRVTGGRQLRAALRGAGVKVTQLSAANRKVSRIVAAESKNLAPRKTGRLRGSIRAGATSTRAVVRVGSDSGVPYAGPIHWGWPKRNIKPTKFVTWATARTRSRWLDVYDQELQRLAGIIERSTGVK